MKGKIIKMKSIGIVRQLDTLGRVVIPIEIRRTLDLPCGTPIEIYVEGDKIVLHKFQHKCEFCGSTDVVAEFKGKAVCKDCVDDIKIINLPD